MSPRRPTWDDTSGTVETRNRLARWLLIALCAAFIVAGLVLMLR